MCRRGEIYNVDFGNNENSYNSVVSVQLWS